MIIVLGQHLGEYIEKKSKVGVLMVFVASWNTILWIVYLNLNFQSFISTLLKARDNL